MFAAPNISDVEAQRAAQPAYGGQTDYNKTVVTTSTINAPPQNISSSNPALVQQQQPQQQQPSATAGSGSADVPKSTMGRVARSIEWGGHLLLLAWFSMVEMIAAAQVCDVKSHNACYGTRGYQVAVGAISLIIALLCGILYYLDVLTNTAFEIFVCVFLFLWWGVAVVVLTFFGDFQLTTLAAGYFGTWFSFGMSVICLIAVSEGFEYGLDKTIQQVRKPVFVLTIASLVCMGANIGPCSGECAGYNGYAIVVSVVSLFIGILLFFFPARLERKGMLGVAAFLVLWWVFGAAIMTLGGPQLVAGNGFFSSWIALIAAVFFLAELNRQV